MNPQDKIRTRQWETLTYRQPEDFLRELRKLQLAIVGQPIDPQVANLRKTSQKKHRERRQAALVCYGLSTLIGTSIEIAEDEKEDFDFITRFPEDKTIYYVPLQLKELPPKFLNPQACIEEEIAKLSKYGATDTTVVIYLNREFQLEFDQIPVPQLKIRSLWLFGSQTPDQTWWFVYGDLLLPLEQRVFHSFRYPEP